MGVLDDIVTGLLAAKDNVVVEESSGSRACVLCHAGETIGDSTGVKHEPTCPLTLARNWKRRARDWRQRTEV
jgi:hypothetical protein